MVKFLFKNVAKSCPSSSCSAFSSSMTEKSLRLDSIGSYDLLNNVASWAFCLVDLDLVCFGGGTNGFSSEVRFAKTSLAVNEALTFVDTFPLLRFC